jgi:hypothetical protein
VPPLRYDPSQPGGPLRQGEVLRDLVEVRIVTLANGDAQAVPTEHALSIVMTQDCDLEQDYFLRFPTDAAPREAEDVDREANALQMLLLCDAYDAGDLILLAEYFPTKFNSKERDKIRGNQNERYHCLDESHLSCAQQVPKLLLDLRTPFAMPVASVYEQLVDDGQASRAGIVPPIFSHDLTQRFHSYHGRVALPPPDDALALPAGDTPPGSSERSESS